MQVSVSSIGSLERRIEVAVPATQVAGEVEQRLKHLSRTARLKGFRPGKAPLTVVRKQFGQQVHAEVVSDLMRSSFTQALDQERLRPAADPRIEPLTLGEGGQDLRYAAVFEVLPEIHLAPLESLAIERPVATVEEADVDAMIESMRRQRPRFTAVDRPAAKGDRATIDFEGRLDGETFEGGTGSGVQVMLGSGQILPEIETALVGVAAGESRTVSATFPPNYGRATLAGRTAEFAVTVESVEEPGLPQVDEEFCREYGVEEGGVDALRAEVKRSMERELAELIRSRLRVQVLDGLFRSNPVELPRTLLEENVTRLQLEAARRMGVRDVKQLPAREGFIDAGRRRAALGLILGQIVQANGLRAERARVMARIEDLAANYPNPEEARRAYMQNEEALRSVESAVLEDTVVDWVLARAPTTDRPMSFKDLTGFGKDSRPDETLAAESLAGPQTASGTDTAPDSATTNHEEPK